MNKEEALHNVGTVIAYCCVERRAAFGDVTRGLAQCLLAFVKNNGLASNHIEILQIDTSQNRDRQLR